MKKEYFIINEEPNVNILGLDPIILAFHSDEFKEYVGKRLTKTFYKLEDGYFIFGTRAKEWIEIANMLFKRIMDNPKFESEVADNVTSTAQKIYSLCKETLKRIEKEEVSEQERIELITEIWKLFTKMCVYGLIAPIVEYGLGGMSKKLEEIIKGKAKDIKIVNEYISLLSYYYEENLDQKGQKELLKIAQRAYKNNELKDLFKKDNKAIKEKLSEKITKEINKYIKEWGWLTYSYAGPEYTIDNAINDIKGMLSLDISPKEQAKRLDQELRDSIKKQQDALKELSLEEKELYVIKVAQNFVKTKYLRTKMMFLADFTVMKLLKFFAQKEGLSLKQIGVCTVNEVLNYFKTGSLPAVDILNKRITYSLLLHEIGSEVVLFGEEAKLWFKENVKIEEIDKNISEIPGQVACTGDEFIIRGKVKIVNLTSDMEKFNDGEILVSVATTPDIVPAMKKASAIISDLGGLTCHAAIISRELKKPCLIGTKIATKVLHDGDEAEVDADKGTVKIINKTK